MTNQETIIVHASEPMPSRVTYEAARNRTVYTPSNVVPGTYTESPSDCVWIVPGER